MSVRRDVVVLFLVLALVLAFAIIARSASAADQIASGSPVESGEVVVPVWGSTSSLVLLVPPGPSSWSVLICDQYGYDHMPYWLVKVADQEDPKFKVTVEPVVSPFVSARLSPPQVSTSPRWRWTREDNFDNMGAFACYRLTISGRPTPEDRDFQVILNRHWKTFHFPNQSNAGDRWGRVEKIRELRVFFRATQPQTFLEWVESIKSGD